MTPLRLISICAVLILLVCACSPETPTPTNAPPVVVSLPPTHTPTITSTPTPRLDLTATAASWTATPSPTAPPEGRWGISVDSDFDPQNWNANWWIDRIPVAWRNPSPDTARYQFSIKDATTVLERCDYGSNRRVVRRQINADAVLIDLESGATLGVTTFTGGLPAGCVPVVSFEPDDPIKYWDGQFPEQTTVEDWLLSTLPDAEPGLATLTATPPATG